MRDHPFNDGERAPGFHRSHRDERQAASPYERGRHRPHALDLDPGELRIGTRLRRAQRQRVLRLIWLVAIVRVFMVRDLSIPGLAVLSLVTSSNSREKV